VSTFCISIHLLAISYQSNLCGFLDSLLGGFVGAFRRNSQVAKIWFSGKKTLFVFLKHQSGIWVGTG